MCILETLRGGSAFNSYVYIETGVSYLWPQSLSISLVSSQWWHAEHDMESFQRVQLHTRMHSLNVPPSHVFVDLTGAPHLSRYVLMNEMSHVSGQKSRRIPPLDYLVKE